MTTNAHPLRAIIEPSGQLALWVVAIGWFGVGDTATTLYGLSLGLSEAHPLLDPAMQSIGTLPTLALSKLALIGLTLGVWAGITRLDRPDLAVGIPMGMFALGFVVTAWNSYLIMTIS